MPVINEDVLCVLRKNAGNDHFSLTYEPIEIQLNEELDELYTHINDANNSGSDVYNFIKNHTTLNVLFKKYNFCTYLNNTTYPAQNDINSQVVYDDLAKIENQFNDPNFRGTVLLTICKLRALAYSLEKAYRDSESNDHILAFSHRRVGWSEKPYQLDANFSIQFKTNFGYVNSSYFYTKLKYKNIEIVPISEWVHYRNAKLSEIISASAVHSVTNESWNQAMEYGQNACNLFKSNETEFVNQYLKQECEKLILGLFNIKSSSAFNLRKNQDRFNPIFEEIVLSGSELVAFRGDKISGALYFIESIKNLESVLSIADYINQIESLNRETLPILEIEFQKILDLLPRLNNQLLDLKEKYDNFNKQDEKYDQIRSMLKEELEITEEYEEKSYSDKRELLDSKFSEKHPEYNIFQKSFNDAKEKYYALDSKIWSLDNDLNSIEESKDKIKSYLKV